MNKFLITGVSGFVGRHFLNFLDNTCENLEVIGLDVEQPFYDFKNYKYIKFEFIKLNLLNYIKLKKILNQTKPNYILHLASFSSVKYSWINPIDSFRNNTNIFLNLISAIRDLNIDCRILSVGSSEEYGSTIKTEQPIKEICKLNPTSPYAAARVSQENLSKIFVDGFGMDIVMTRSFNHIGPYQDSKFVIPSFINQVLKIKNSEKKTGTIKTGDTSIIRDFVDVRDVVSAYYLLLKNGINGEIYNICSGKGYSLNNIIKIISDISEISLNIKIDNKLIRPIENKVIIGDNKKLKSETGWDLNFNINQSLNDVYFIMKNTK